MPTNSDMNKKEAQKMYDKEVARFAKRIAAAYSSDKIRLVTSRNARRAVLLHDIDAINDIIKDIPNMPAGFQSDFCDAFIGEDMAGLDLATPAILGYAYRAISARAAGGESGQKERLDKLAARIDDLSADFKESGGMVVRQNEWPLINMSNIANENEDFSIMLDARMSDVDDAKKAEMTANKEHADTVAQNYDKAWNLDNLNPEDVDKLADRADEVYEVLHDANIRESVMKKLAKVKMLDAKGRVIPQFTSGKRGDYNEYEDYEPGFEISDDSRYESIAELVEHDIAKRYIADVNAEIDKDTIEDEFNETLLIKLYEIYAADQIVRGAAEKPEQFNNPEFRRNFEKMLEPDGDGVEISDNGYNVAIETQTDATVGWFARLRRKIGGDGKKLEKLWKKLNRSLEHIDDMADVRMSRAAVERRKKRRNFAGRVLIGFTSSFIASAFITVSATAAAARLGKSLAWGSVYVGGGAALGIMGFQIARWIRNQKKNNLPVSWEEFIKNEQLMRSLMTSGLAIVAMVLSALGLAGVGMAVGIGAVLLGAYNNGRGVFEAARDVKMSRRQRIAWTIANVASFIFGALGGKSFAQYGIAKYNQWNPENAWLQNREATPGKLEKVSDEITHEKTIMHYSDDMLQSAKDAVEGWYAHDYPNHPEILQQDIDAVNQYNADHGTNFDPYRILRAMKMSQPSRLAYTPAWGDTYNVPQETINLSANAVGGGTYNSAGIESAHFLESHFMGNNGNIGPVGNFTNTTYSPITELPTQTTKTVIDQPAKYEPTGYDVRTEPINKAGYGAFGNYPKRDRASVKTAVGDKVALLHDRIGSFLDRVRRNRQNESVSEDVPPVIRNDEPKDEVPPIVLDERDEELRIPEEKTSSPARREYVAPKISLNSVFPKPLEDMPTALPDPENRKYEPLPDLAFALTEDQAERWNDLHEQLATVRAEIRNPYTHTDKKLKLRKKANRLTKEIHSFAEELGNPTVFEIEQALAEIERRKKLQSLLKQYENHILRKPKGSDVPDWWNAECKKLLDKIADLGGKDSLNDSNLRFAAPALGRLEQKRAEVAQREKERQEQKHDVFVMPMREQPEQLEEPQMPEPEHEKQHIDMSPKLFDFDNVNVRPKAFDFEHQKPDFENHERWGIGNHTTPHPVLKSFMLKNLVTYPLMDVRGVPVKLLDLDGNNNPITNNDGRAMVVVDIDGLRIPFYLANGDESSGLETPGKWYPMFLLMRDGQWFFDSTVSDYIKDESEAMSFIKDIAEKLNMRIGDIRDNIDNITHVDPGLVYDMVNHTPNTLTKYMWWAPSVGNNMLNAHVPWIKWYFDNIQAPDYDEAAHKRQLREEKKQAKRELREEKKQAKREQNQGFFSGIGDFIERDVRGRFFRWGEDSNEYE